MPSRPSLVILTGWLGCRPHQLRRYEELYRRQGLQVLSYIAAPSAIFECTLPQYSPTPAAAGASSSSSSTSDGRAYGVHALVEAMLRDLTASECRSYLFHAFSNGGCFVWEAFRRATPLPPAGLVLDSCPSFELHRMAEVLDLLPWSERLRVAGAHGRDYWRAQHAASWRPRVQPRADRYRRHLEEDPWRVPQLFLYSRSDPLIAHGAVAALAAARRARGVDVTERVWDVSRHCGHYIDHKDDYEAAIHSFLDKCSLTRQEPQARL